MQQDVLTVPQAAKRAHKNPETIRRWIREGKLLARKIGTQHFIEEDDLEATLGGPDTVSIPKGWWRKTHGGEPMPDVVKIIHQQRGEH
jgi:excisionase family DNA binding protein